MPCRARIRLLGLVTLWAGLALLIPRQATAEGTPDAAVLGKALFFDTSLSADGTVACATCHRPESAFSDPRPLSRGVLGRVGTRNAPALIGVSDVRELFWEGRRRSLEELVLDPLTTPEEHGLDDPRAVLEAVRTRQGLAFTRVFPGEGVTPRTVGLALAAYVRALTPAPSPFERYQRGEAAALTLAQRRGLALFTGRAACSRCHVVEGGAFSDGDYHPGEVLAELAPRMAAAARETAGLSLEQRRRAVPARAEVAALGRYLVTLRPTDIGRFRTPSLRNVAVTAPYMHDGGVSSLAEAVERELYYRANEGRRVGDLTPAERADLVEFLQSLTNPVPPSSERTAPSSLH